MTARARAASAWSAAMHRIASSLVPNHSTMSAAQWLVIISESATGLWMTTALNAIMSKVCIAQ